MLRLRPTTPYEFFKLFAAASFIYFLIWYYTHSPTTLVSLISWIFSKSFLITTVTVLAGNVAGMFSGAFITHIVPDPKNPSSTLYQRLNNDYVAPFLAMIIMSGPIVCCPVVWIHYYSYYYFSSSSLTRDDVPALDYYVLRIFAGSFLYEFLGVSAVPLALY